MLVCFNRDVSIKAPKVVSTKPASSIKVESGMMPNTGFIPVPADPLKTELSFKRPVIINIQAAVTKKQDWNR